MNALLLALDPGTRNTGWAVFNGEDLLEWGSVTAPGNGEIEERIPAILRGLDEVAERAGPGLAGVTAEQPTGLNARRPAPELQALVRRIRRWARGRKLEWTAYSQSKVAASVRIRGDRKRDRKAQILAGVEALYPQTRGRWEGGQDAADAVAAGHCHLAALRENRTTGPRAR